MCNDDIFMPELEAHIDFYLFPFSFSSYDVFSIFFSTPKDFEIVELEKSFIFRQNMAKMNDTFLWKNFPIGIARVWCKWNWKLFIDY